MKTLMLLLFVTVPSSPRTLCEPFGIQSWCGAVLVHVSSVQSFPQKTDRKTSTAVMSWQNVRCREPSRYKVVCGQFKSSRSFKDFRTFTEEDMSVPHVKSPVSYCVSVLSQSVMS